jgi:hypothetical protein
MRLADKLSFGGYVRESQLVIVGMIINLQVLVKLFLCGFDIDSAEVFKGMEVT